MSSNEVWATCGDCGAELKQSDKQCPKCGSTKKAYQKKASVPIGLVLSGKSVHKRKGIKRPLKEIIFNRWKRSGDPELMNGVREDRTIDRENDEYHQVVKDAKTGKVTHEEHQQLSEHNKQGKNRRVISKKLGKWGLGAIITIVLALIGSLIWFYILPHLPSEQPMSPSVIFSPSPNPKVNTPTTQSITITATPDFKPPYSNDIDVTIQNPNPYKCYMVLEFKSSDGFNFLPISDSLPENFRVEEGYEYKDVMKVYIKDFPPKFAYNLRLSVYTMTPNTFGGTEKISWKVLEVRQED